MLEGLFGVVSRLFSVSVIERQPWELDAQTWDEGVRFFEVTLIALVTLTGLFRIAVTLLTDGVRFFEIFPTAPYHPL